MSPESSTMMHQAEEEMQHDILKLQDQVKQISLSQIVTKNELESKMDGLEEKIKGNMEVFKVGRDMMNVKV